MEELVEAGGLLGGARRPVEHPAACGFGFEERLMKHLDHVVGGGELTGFHGVLHASSEARAFFCLGSEEGTHGEVGGASPGREVPGLGALARTWWSDDDDSNHSTSVSLSRCGKR